MRSSLPATLVAALLFAGATFADPVIFRVHMPALASGPVSGRLLLFAEPLATAQTQAEGGPIKDVDSRLTNPTQTAIAAQEVLNAAPGSIVDVDADLIAYPSAFAKMPAGVYAVQAVLDVNHRYAYAGREAGDLLSPVTVITLPLGGDLTLSQTIAAPPDPWLSPAGAPADARARQEAARADSHPIDFISSALSRFWGRPIHMRGWLVTPPGYGAHPGERYPTVYFTHGFGGSLRHLVDTAVYVHDAMADGSAPPMIWVLLDESSASGTHEFANSVNNGPWGEALTTELIPYLEHVWRMDARTKGRFLNGHSSGGWATLWLQTRYPALFGGTWSTSPDPSDFHDFTGSDLYAPGASLYRRSDGTPAPIVRDHGRVLAKMEDFARIEAVEGAYGGQMSSFDWVFSPRGPDGRPEPMFDRATGAVDPVVVAYWRENYDIAYRIARDWTKLRPELDGKIHLIVGTADTFYLDGAARRLKAVLDALGARSDIRFLPERTHFDLYGVGGDSRGLLKQIAWEMYAVARPDAKRPAPLGQLLDPAPR
ncbi:MAG TPA: alpha/beta hydrolase-fold protein [Caulobacteraceae bacterium]